MAGLSDLFTALNNIAANLGRLVAQTALEVVVPVDKGGTGDISLTAHGVLIGQGTNPVVVTSPGAVGTVLAGAGASADPVFSATLSGLTSVEATTVSAGLSGTAGAFDVFPATASKGKTEFTGADNIGNTTTTIRTAAQAGTRTYTIPDEGGSASFLLTAASLGTNGLIAYPLALLGFKNGDGTTLAASASSGKFGISLTPGTSEALTGEAATSNTKTDVLAVEVVLPPWYIAGQNVTLTVNSNFSLGGGGLSAIGTHTLAAAAYLNTTSGTQGSTLIATAAQSVPASPADVTFTITGTTLLPSSRLILTLTMVIQEIGGGTATGQVNSVRLS